MHSGVSGQRRLRESMLFPDRFESVFHCLPSLPGRLLPLCYAHCIKIASVRQQENVAVLLFYFCIRYATIKKKRGGGFVSYINGDRIRDLRLSRGLSQDQLAELASLNRVTVAKYEAGRVEPGAQALGRLADALDVSVDELLGRVEPSPEDEALAIRERLRRDPAYRLLFDAAGSASPDHLRAAAAMLKALEEMGANADRR